jgi:CheY-like chemotaxis protein
MLSHWDLKPILASSGKEAVLKFNEAGQSGNPVRLAIIDFDLMDLNGLDVVRKIQSLETYSDQPIILISSVRARRELAKHIKSDGISILTKPVKQTVLIDTINRLTDAEHVHVAPAKKNDNLPYEFQSSKVKVLLAEDDETNRLLASTLLEKAGCKVTTVDDGRSAVEEAMRKRYDFIFLDIRMPVMGGVDAARAIRGKEISSGKRNIIIAMTAEDSPESRANYSEAGMDDVLLKPINQMRIIEILGKYGAASSVQVNEKIESNSKTKLNWSRILSRAADDPSILKEVIDVFLQDYPVMMRKLQAAIAIKNADEVEKRAHKLKGAVAVFEHQESYQNALELEKISRSKDLENAEVIFNRLNRSLEVLEKLLKSTTDNSPAKQFK